MSDALSPYTTPKTGKTAAGRPAWIHAEAPDKHEQEILHTEYGIAKRMITDALDPDEVPRLEHDAHYTYIFTRFAYDSTTRGIRTTPILFALNGNRLITITSGHLPDIESLSSDSKEVAAQSDPVLCMLHILLHIDTCYDNFINHSTHKIRKLKDRLGRHDISSKELIQFVHIEDDIHDFLGSLEPTNAALRHLVTNKPKDSFQKHRELVDTVILNNEQSMRSCKSSLKTLNSIRRTYTMVSSYHLDRTIKILTLASVFISIPTMFFSMYGMNIEMPIQRSKLAFTLILVMCFVIVLTAYAAGRKKRVF